VFYWYDVGHSITDLVKRNDDVDSEMRLRLLSINRTSSVTLEH